MADSEALIHATGFWDLMRKLEISQRTFANNDLVLPAPDVDLEKLKVAIVPAPDPLKNPDKWRYDARRKQHALQQEFTGQSQLMCLHAMLISILRRHNPPQGAIDLFHRIWAEQGEGMARDLSVRWLISAATTFADCGKTNAQRSAGMGLSIMFDLIKLHDTERRASGQPNDKAFPRKKGRKQHDLAFDMAPYSLDNGDLDRIMLARIWKLCQEDDGIAHLGVHMLNLVMSDRRSVFARVQHYRRKVPEGERNAT